MRTIAHLAICLLLVCFLPRPAHAEDAPTTESGRKPAPIMSFHGADWLERPEREEEERPAEVIAAMGLKAGDVIADIGCGTGYFSRRFAKTVGETGKVYGVEIQPEFIEMLKENCAKENIANVVPTLGTEKDPLLPPGSCDWIFMSDVYHEFQYPKEMLAAFKTALKPDGRILLLEYRLLGDTARHIKEDHRMSVKQVLAEWQPAGYELIDLLDFLPSQHLFVWHRRPGC